MGGKRLDNTAERTRTGALRDHFQFTANGKRFVYCRIRKNGCSAFQQFIIKTSPYACGRLDNEFAFLRKRHRVPSLSALASADHRILVFRDPVERLQSLFVNKFVQRQQSTDIFNSYKSITGNDPCKANFNDFIDYVSRLGITPLDPHVWPQHWHLCNVVYDCVFPLDNLYKSMAQMIGPKLAQSFHRKVNPSPRYSVAVRADLRERILEIYAEDLRMIERIN